MTDVVLLCAVAAVVLVASDLYRRNKELRSELGSRLDRIEQIGEPFAEKLRQTNPPLMRALSLGLYVDETFWRDTLQCSEEEFQEIRRSAAVRNDLSRKGAEEFEKHFYADVLISFQEWRGGHTHIEIKVDGPHDHRHSINLYPGGRSDVKVWCLYLRDEFMGPVIRLSFDGYTVKLSAEGGRFGFIDDKATESWPENIFLTVPLKEVELSAFHKPDYKIEIHENVYKDIVPWLRCYQEIDTQKGLAWQLWVHDLELFTLCGGSAHRAALIQGTAENQQA